MRSSCGRDGDLNLFPSNNPLAPWYRIRLNAKEINHRESYLELAFVVHREAALLACFPLFTQSPDRRLERRSLVMPILFRVSEDTSQYPHWVGIEKDELLNMWGFRAPSSSTSPA